MKTSVILPTFNEGGNIVELIKKIINFFGLNDFEVIVVDDNSPDGTASLIRTAFKDEPRVKCYVRENEKGLGTAIGFGIRQATGQQVIFMDADGNHDPKYIPVFVNLMKYYDAVMGSRYGWGGGMDASRFRYYGSYIFSLFVSIMLGLTSRDNTSGYMIIKKELLDGMDLENIFQGYGEWTFSLLYNLKNKEINFVEIPIFYPKRTDGKSKTKFVKYFFVYASRVISLALKDI